MRVFLPLFLAACTASDVAPLGTEASAKSLTGSPTGVGLLAFMNDASTTFEVLDVQVPLDARAARNLIASRDRAAFTSVEQIDAVAYVGTAAMAALESYVTAQGWVPEGDELLGTWDGVSFTVNEAEQVLAFVDEADLTTLDDTVGLDRRAATSIANAGTLETVLELSELYYVGGTALGLLKEHAVVVEEPVVEEEEEVAEEEEEPCTPTVATSTNPDADDYTRLQVLATTSDYPYGEVRVLQASGCSDWSAPTEALTQAIWNATFWWTWDEIGRYRVVGSWTAGGSDFNGMLDTTLDGMEDRVSSDGWDPNSSAEAAALWAERDALVDAMQAGPTADPASYMEISLEADLSECTQDAVALLDVRDGTVLVVHRFPGC